MAPKDALGGLVEHLAEAEQILSGSSGGSGTSQGGSSSVVASEERDSVVEAAAVMDDLERSSSVGTRSEAGSEGSRPHPREAGSAADDPSPGSERVAALRADEDDSVFQPSLHSLSLLQRLRNSEQAKRELDVELNSMEATMVAMEKSSAEELEEMKGQMSTLRLNAANSVLIQKKSRSHMDEISKMKAWPDSGLSGDATKEDLMRQLTEANVTNLEMVDELTELRSKMLHNEKLRQVEVGDLNMLLDTANFQLEMSARGEVTTGSDSSSSHLLNKPLGGRRKATPKAGGRSTLLAIAEDDSDAGSAYSGSGGSGFNVSGDGDGFGGGVGDLRDFEDDNMLDSVIQKNERAMEVIRGMEEAAVCQGLIAKDLRDQAALRESESEARIELLMEQLEASHRSHALTREELDALKELVSEKDKGQAPELQGLSKLLEATATQDPRAPRPANPGLQQSTAGTEDLREQLNALRESNRIAEARVEDLKRALASEEAKHRKDNDDLTRRLQRRDSEADDDAKESELRELRDLLKSVQEERNLLVNTFECKELQLKTQIENLQLELEEAKRRHESEISGPEPTMSAQEVAAKTAVDASYVSQDVSAAAKQSVSILGWLRCPMRSAGGDNGLKPALCQELCWKMICAMSGVVAFWCCARDYTILQTTREANRTWGNAMLLGKTIFSLTSGTSSEAWLKKAFHSHQRVAEVQEGRGLSGFVVRDLGCEYFRTKSGDAFDAVVITARFPAEPACGREPALFVVLELQQSSGLRGGAESSRARGGGLQRRGAARSSSEVSTSSVSPSDSASNVQWRSGAF